MTTPALPTDLDATYSDYGDPSVKLHQQWHDSIHTELNKGLVVKSGGSVITASGAAVKPLVLKGASGQTADLFTAQNNDGSASMVINSAGSLVGFSGSTAQFALRATGNGFITNSVPANVVLSIRGAASQTANLAEFQDSTGDIRSRIGSKGELVVVGGVGGIGIHSVSASVGAIPLVVQGAASQTSPLVQFRDSSGTSLLSVIPSGRFNFAGINTDGNALGSFQKRVFVQVDGVNYAMGLYTL